MTTPHTYPYTMVDGHVILDCEGRRLLLDTGSPSCVYPEETMPFAGARHPSSGDYLGVSLEEVSGHVGTRLDGLIGADALDPYDTVIDPGRRDVRLYQGDHDLEGTRLVLDCSMIVPIFEVSISGEPVRVIFDTGAKLSYLDRALIEAFPPAGTREDFFPGLGTFNTDTFETPLTLGPNTVTITTGALTSIPALALTLVGARGILGSALFDHFAVGYSPRRSQMTIAVVDTSRQHVDGIDTSRQHVDEMR
jgi:hypothetical protein